MRSQNWLVAVAVLLGLIVAVGAYDVGLMQGAARAAAAAGADAAGAVPPYYWYGWGWHRPWGFGFGFPLFILFWFVIARGFLWGGPWRRRWYHDHHDWDEWHRRAHEQMNAPK